MLVSLETWLAFFWPGYWGRPFECFLSKILSIKIINTSGRIGIPNSTSCTTRPSWSQTHYRLVVILVISVRHLERRSSYCDEPLSLNSPEVQVTIAEVRDCHLLVRIQQPFVQEVTQRLVPVQVFLPEHQVEDRVSADDLVQSVPFCQTFSWGVLLIPVAIITHVLGFRWSRHPGWFAGCEAGIKEDAFTGLFTASCGHVCECVRYWNVWFIYNQGSFWLWELGQIANLNLKLPIY